MGRADQVARALAEQERLQQIDAMDLDQLRDEYDEGWARVREAMRALEPVHRAYLARVARRHGSDLTAIPIEATDQGGSGWVLGLSADDMDDLRDDDTLSMLLYDLGAWLPSEDHPAQELPLDFEPRGDV